jgi:hypothetical protein
VVTLAASAAPWLPRWNTARSTSYHRPNRTHSSSAPRSMLSSSTPSMVRIALKPSPALANPRNSVRLKIWWWRMLNCSALVWFGLVDEDTRLEIAQQRYNAGDYRGALDYCNALYMQNPRNLDNLLLIGAAYYQVFPRNSDPSYSYVSFGVAQCVVLMPYVFENV